MSLYEKIRQKPKPKSNLAFIADHVGVTEDYVRKILMGKRDGTVHKDGKGKQIIELAEQLTKE